MAPAFRSTASALAFSALLAFLLALPVIESWIGLPPREQAYRGVSAHTGAIGNVVWSIYEDSQDADILFLGSSLVRRSIGLQRVEDALSSHLGRRAHVAELAMDWAGLDMQYFLLRDYLARHHPRLIVWNEPEQIANSNELHTQAYRWLRYGEYRDAFAGIPLIFRIQVYAGMVLGAPKELLYKLRGNLLSGEEMVDREGEDNHRNLAVGYHHGPFVPDTIFNIPARQARLLPVTSPSFQLAHRPFRSFPLHFSHDLVALARKKGCPLVFLHVPEDEEFGDTRIPEVTDWSKLFGPQYKIIGIPSTVLFAGLTRERYLHFYTDLHLNANGRVAFTEAIIPPVLEAYDQAK